MKVLVSILGAATLVILFFVFFSKIIPSLEFDQTNIFTVKVDVELAYDKYEFTWNAEESTIVVIKTWNGKPMLDIKTELTAQESALLKSLYSKLDITSINPKTPLSTDGSWWHITNHGHSFSIRNPDDNIKERNLEQLYKLVKNIEKFSTIKKYGKTNT